MGINATNTQSYYLEALKNQQPQNNFRLANSYVNTPMFNNNVQQPAVDSFNNKTLITADGKDDGSIGFVKAVGNLFKGVGNFFKGMVCDENGKFSITRTLTTIGIGAAIGVACAFLPTIAVAGMTLSTLGLISAGFGAIAAYHIGDAAIDIMSAKTDAEAEQGWQNLGSGLTEGGLAYLGYRASGGIMAKDTVAPTPSGSAPKTPKTPKTTTEEAPVEPTRTSAPKAEAEAKAKAEAEAKAKAEAEAKVKAEAEAKVKAEAEAKAKAEAEAKAKAEAEAKAKAEAEAKAKAEAEAKAKAEAEAKAKAEAEAKAKAEAEAKAKAEAEAKAKAEAEVKKVNPEEINKNISYKESHDLKVFADENNNRIRQREYQKSQGIELPVNEKSLKVESEMKSMDAIFDKAVPLENESVVYRGYDLCAYPIQPIDTAYVNMMKNVKKGDVITPDAGYTFVALEKAEIQGNYASTGVIEIRLPKGTKIVTHDGWEALLPRNASYKVIDKQIVDGKVNYIFEYILPEG